MRNPIQSYDPIGPIRSPLSKRSKQECVKDMGAVMALVAASNDGIVTKDDLHRAGFTNGEIETCHGDAVALAAVRLAPREQTRVKAAA